MKMFKALYLIFVLFSVCFSQNYKEEDLGDLQVFPKDNYWHWDISKYAVHPNSQKIIESLGKDTVLYPDFLTKYSVVRSGISKFNISFSDNGDAGPYPLPDNVQSEAAKDFAGTPRVIIIDKDNKILYEIAKLRFNSGKCDANYGAIFRLNSNDLRTDGFATIDDAGLPVFPGLIRYEETTRGEINHAIRLSIKKTQRKYIWPARHSSGTFDDADLPMMGLRLRLKADYNISGFSRNVQVMLTAMKKYGLIVADLGDKFYVSGTGDSRWANEIFDLGKVKASDFEVLLTVDEKGKPIGLMGISAESTPLDRVKAYPNPAIKGGKVRFLNLPSGSLNIKIYTNKDKLVSEVKNKSGEILWDGRDSNGSAVEPGNYKIKIIDSKNHEKTLDIVIIEKK